MNEEIFFLHIFSTKSKTTPTDLPNDDPGAIQSFNLGISDELDSQKNSPKSIYFEIPALLSCPSLGPAQNFFRTGNQFWRRT